jgi:hypothetical protein
MLFSLVQLLAQTNMKGNMMTKTREQDDKTTKGSKMTKKPRGARRPRFGLGLTYKKTSMKMFKWT